MALLLEFGDWLTIDDRAGFVSVLNDVARSRASLGRVADESGEEEGDESPTRQSYFQFDGNRIRANGHVGFVQHGDLTVEVYPKVFRALSDLSEKRELMLRHLFHWFSYCRKSQFPFQLASLDVLEADNFPELIIYLIAKQIHSAATNTPFNAYQRVEEVLTAPRGAIDFSRYTASNLARGNFHRIDCRHEPFLFDNKLNRVIKYCARLLMGQTRLAENHRLLQEITFILGDVEDEVCAARDLDSLKINPFFSEYLDVVESCRIVLNQQVFGLPTHDMQQWCLLFPMSYVYEDYLAGFLESELGNDWKVEYQKSDRYVSEHPRAFRMQHDIFLTSRVTGKQIIVDAKYKVRSGGFKNDPKKEISQSDLYQMVTYAVKRNCSEILILYPNTGPNLHVPDKFLIETTGVSSGFIKVIAAEVPFWTQGSLGDLASQTKGCLNDILAAC